MFGYLKGKCLAVIVPGNISCSYFVYYVILPATYACSILLHLNTNYNQTVPIVIGMSTSVTFGIY